MTQQEIDKARMHYYHSYVDGKITLMERNAFLEALDRIEARQLAEVHS